MKQKPRKVKGRGEGGRWWSWNLRPDQEADRFTSTYLWVYTLLPYVRHTVQSAKAPTMEAFPILFQIKFGYPKFEFAQSANSIPL